MRHGLIGAIVAILVASSAGGCVYHYCGPAYPNSTDPFCSIHRPPPPV